ncbi:MAG: DUF1732 domain-containing protein, partial [Nannocystaceae bacterium]|nr:DUF1732 domain-containing protein [Nannocystaceae bacterium]
MSLRSMTGFGTAARPWVTPDGPGTLDVEVRSVNARFLELKIRQPFGAVVEQTLRRQLGQRLGRGRVDVTIAVRAGESVSEQGSGVPGPAPSGTASKTPSEDALRALGIDPGQVDQALAAVAALAERIPSTLQVTEVNPAELLRMVMSAPRATSSATTIVPPQFLDAVLDDAVTALVAFRSREGAALDAAIAKLAEDLARQVAALTASLDPEAERLAARVRQRIGEVTARLSRETGALGTLDPDRVAQEIALVIARGDVTEELDRIDSHLTQLRGVLVDEAGQGQGKTLEFVAQELFREITTIGSKITSHEGSRIVIEAKGTIERIR